MPEQTQEQTQPTAQPRGIIIQMTGVKEWQIQISGMDLLQVYAVVSLFYDKLRDELGGK